MITKKELLLYPEKLQKDIIALGDELFDCAELGFREFKTGERITSLLDEWNIPYEKNIAKTGIIARIGEKGGYHIALAADIDALPGRDGKGNIHSCGHSIQTTVALYILKILHQTGIVKNSGCLFSVFFTPAEEFVDLDYRRSLIDRGEIAYFSGKQCMLTEGYFDDADCVLSIHANGEKDVRFDIDSTLSGFSVKKAVFHGIAAHSGASPYLGRNTLHGALLALNALSFIKEQFPPAAGLIISPVITKGGGSVNAVPDETVIETYIRANDTESLISAEKRFDECILKCGEILQLRTEIKTEKGYLPLRQSKELNDIIAENIRLIRKKDDFIRGIVSGASGDIGDISFLLPTVQLGFSGIEGRFHDDSFRISDKENCYIETPKLLLAVIYDLLTNKDIRVSPEGFYDKKETYMQIMQKNV